MKLISAGAAQTVTGSCHFLELNGLKLVVDCGLFQGGRETEALNYEPFPFEPGELDAVLVTHGHLDHVGRLPLLTKQGYSGPVYATRATRRVTEVILQDSAKIQSEDYDRALRKAERSGRKDKVEKPLYSESDVEQVMNLFKPVEFGAGLELGNKVTAHFYPAGHILGSAFIELNSPDGRVILSGDLGNRESSLQADFQLPKECDAVLVETTYGNRTHRSQAATLEEFRAILNRAEADGGKIMIPTFALERTQVILYQLKQMQEAGEVGKLPVFLDSPMAATFTELYQESANEFLPAIREALEQGENPFTPEQLKTTNTRDESIEINDFEGTAIIVAGSGMMTGGRIGHHLKHNLWRENADLLVVGYQANGTLGRRLVDGANEVRIYGDEIKVRAQVHTIGGFSAHGDQDDLLAWLEPTGNATVYMVHGEIPVMNVFGDALSERGREPVSVVRNEPYEL